MGMSMGEGRREFLELGHRLASNLGPLQTFGIADPLVRSPEGSAEGLSLDYGRYAGPRKTLPGSAPVILALSSTGTPLTRT